jgi:hypothetical protein
MPEEFTPEEPAPEEPATDARIEALFQQRILAAK